MKRYMKRKLAYGKLPNPFVNWSTLKLSKIIYLTMWIILPMPILDLSWWKILIGFFIMHYTAGG